MGLAGKWQKAIVSLYEQDFCQENVTMPVVIGDLRLYTLEEIEDLLNVSRRTLYSYIKSGRLKSRKFGSTTYVSEDALREYFNPPKKSK